MRLALVATDHWHVPMYLEAFSALGTEIGLFFFPEGELTWWGLDPQPPRLASLEDVAAARPDAVLVLGRPDWMLATVRRCLELGLRVGVEKPVGTDAAALQALSASAGAQVMVAQPHLLNDFWRFVPPDPGRLSHFRFRLINGSPQRYRDWGVPWVLKRGVAGGGVMRNLGVHGISAFQKLTGQGVEVRSALLSSVLYGLEVEEYASTQLTAGGALGQVEVGYTLGSDQASEFEMTAHWQHLSLRDDGANVLILDRRRGEKRVVPCLPLPRRYEQFAQSVLDALSGKPTLVHDLTAHAQAMQTIDQVYRVAKWVNA